jgi:hypothetical protein
MVLSEFKEIIKELSRKRKIFHSEDDLKFSLAMEIKNYKPSYQIFLERPISFIYDNMNQVVNQNEKGQKIESRASIDIILKTIDNQTIPIELKYKTKKVSLFFDEEEYNLANHDAKDEGRFSFRKDIYRIEKFIEMNPNSNRGYALIVTNDKSYFKDISNTNKLDRNYSFHNECEIPKIDKGWNYNDKIMEKYHYDSNNNLVHKVNNKPHWTCLNKLNLKLDLKNDYKVNWEDWDGKSDKLMTSLTETSFHFCLLEIK